MSDDPLATYLSFEDIRLTFEDVDLLRGPFWLNDQVITFACEYFESKGRSDLAYVCPDTVQLVKFLDPTELPEILAPLKLGEKSLIFFPLNDNRTTSAGGSHWSLLLWFKQEGFFHVDSGGNSNFDIARQTAQKLAKALGLGFKGLNQIYGPRQDNCYDCGVYVIGFMRLIGNYYVKHGQLPDSVESFRPDSLRKELIEIIDELRKEKK